ncbi:MAG: CDP-alcohol phosphatidyltransferase family protein [Alphaproteobacteria bacterium]
MRHLPNALTLARLLLGIMTALLILAPEQPDWTGAALAFTAGALSDGLDGWLARRLDARSRFGATLDPLADKVLVGGALLGVMVSGPIGPIDRVACALILLRELLVPVFRLIAARRGMALPVTGLAKVKTAVQMAAVLALMAAAGWTQTVPGEPGRGLLWLAAAFTVLTGIGYGRAALGSTHRAAPPRREGQDR